MLIAKFGANMLSKGDTTFIVVDRKRARPILLSTAILVIDFCCCYFILKCNINIRCMPD